VLGRRIHDMRRAKLPGLLHVVRASNSADDESAAPSCQLSRDGSHTACSPGDQYGETFYRPVGEESSMNGYARNSEACSLFERDTIGKVDRLPRRDGYKFRCGAKWAIRLRTEAPHAFAEAR